MQGKDILYLVAGFILSRIFSMPFQLATGLLSPSVKRWFDARLRARAFAKSKKMQTQYEEAHYFVTYPHKMTQYFLNRGLELFRLSIFLIIGWGGLLWGPVKITSGVWGNVSWLVAMGSLAFLLFVISQSINQLHEIYYRVDALSV